MAFYYKMQAPCSASPTGFISWVNRTGDDTGKPACAGILGETVIIAQWPSYDRSKGTIIEDNRVTTHNATSVKNVLLWDMPDETEVTILFLASAARQTLVTKAASLQGKATYRRSGGAAPALVGAPEYQTSQETDVAYDANFVVSGNTINCGIQNPNTDVTNWNVAYRIQSTLSAAA